MFNLIKTELLKEPCSPGCVWLQQGCPNATATKLALSWERRQATASIDWVSLTSKTFIKRIGDYLKVVLDIVLFCARQDFPLCVHRENADAVNKGNFVDMFKYDPRIPNCPEQLPRNWTLMSLNVQNEQLESAGTGVALLILRCFIFAHDGISQEVMCISHIGLLLKATLFIWNGLLMFLHRSYILTRFHCMWLIEMKECVVLSHVKHGSAGCFHTLISVQRTFDVFHELTKALMAVMNATRCVTCTD